MIKINTALASVGDQIADLLDQMYPDVTCDCGMVCSGEVTGEADQMLKWDCPKCGPMSDVNV